MIKILQLLVIFWVFIFTNTLTSQSAFSGLFKGLPKGFSIGGYTDFYYAYDDDRNLNPRSFSSIASYRDEFRLNIVQATVKYESKKVRGIITLHYGDMVNLNWPKDYRYMQEFNFGFSPFKNTWIDGGYFLTHIGGEGVSPMFNYFQSLSLCTHYEPFFQEGLRLSYTGKKFYGALHLLNGFNVFTDNNKNKSIGVTLGFKPNSKMEFIFNNIAGNEQPSGDPAKLRIYNNLILKFYPHKKVDIILCGDFCYQEKSKISDLTKSAGMYSAFASVKFRLHKRISASIRGEMIRDVNGVMTGTFIDSDDYITGLKAFGISGALEINPVNYAYVRAEARYLMADSKQKIFYGNSNSRMEVILSSGIQF